MKYGSMMNLLASRSPNPTPEVGMGATMLMWSDREAGTVVEVKGKRLVWRQDKATRADTNGMSDCQSYTYEPDPEGRTEVFTLRKNGEWVREGDSQKNGTSLGLGYRSKYYDYSF